MTPFIQQLVLTGRGRLGQSETFVGMAAGSTPTTSDSDVAPPDPNNVWVIYEFDTMPNEDPNIEIMVTGPNVIAGATLGATGGTIAVLYVGTAGSPVSVTYSNGTNAPVKFTMRYVEITAETYRRIVDPTYSGETAAWMHILNGAGSAPTAKGARRNG
jgi:hypothetical protein